MVYHGFNKPFYTTSISLGNAVVAKVHIRVATGLLQSNTVQYTYMFPWVWDSVLRAGGCLGSRELVDMSAGVRDTLLIPPVRCMPHP